MKYLAVNKKFLAAFFSIAALLIIFLAGQVAAASGSFTIWRTMDSGTAGGLYSIWGSAADDTFIVGKSGTILHYDGIDWTPVSSGTTQDLYGIWGADSSHVYAVGSAGTVIHFDGSDWKTADSGISDGLNCIWGTGPADIFAAGQNGVLIHYDGSRWNSLNSTTTADLYGIWGTKINNIFAVGESGTILHFDGTDWSTMESGTVYNLYCIWGIGDGEVFAAGESGTILHYNGSIWNSLNSGTVNDLNGIWGTGAGEIFVVGGSGTILHYDGTGWNSMNRNTLNELQTVYGFTAIDVFAAGQAGTVLRYLPPVIESISYNQGVQGQTLSVTLGGRNLSTISEVRFGSGIAVNTIDILNPSQISVNITIVTGAETGKRDISVTAPGGSFTLPGAFTVKQALPSLTSVSPDQGKQGAELNVTLTGQNLAETSEIRFGAGIVVNSFSVLSANQIKASLSIAAEAEIGERDILIATPGGSFILPNSFTVKQALPTITAISPDQGNKEASLTVTIEGANLIGTVEVSLGAGITVNSFTVLSSKQLTASITISGSAELGTRDISVTTPGGGFILPNSFVVKQALPVIISLSPESGSQGATLNLTITGANFTGASQLQLGPGIAVNNIDVLSPDQLTAKITIMTSTVTGARDITLTTPGGSVTLHDCFSVKQGPPVISSISPEQGSQGANLTLIISGSNLNDAAAISLGTGITVQSFTNLSPTQLSVKVVIDEEAAPGLRDVTVTTPGGSSTLGNCFSIKESSTATFFVALLWVIIALVVLLFVLVLHKLRKKRVF